MRPLGAITLGATAPKGTSDVQTELQPGLYVAFDASRNNPTGGRGRRSRFQGQRHPASLPRAKAKVKAIEFAFKAPSTLHDGELVRFENRGFLVHMIDAIKVKDRRNAKTLVKLLRAGKDGKAFHLAQGDISFLDPVSSGAVQQEKVKAKPGIYVLACFMDTQDGREHTQLGMERIIHIAK